VTEKFWKTGALLAGRLFAAILCYEGSADYAQPLVKETKMQLRVIVTSMTIIIATATPVLAAEFWVSQDPATKHCKIVETMPDGKTAVMIGATSYPTKDEAKKAKKAAVEAGQCIKKDKEKKEEKPN
jgi:vancomycin permeability regulator SanA